MDKQFLSLHYDQFCYTNIELIHGEIRGIILCFCGLGHIVNPGIDMINAPAAAENNILYIIPCYNPWAWMNKKTLAFVDMLVEIAMEKWNLPSDLPVGIYGRSMGGYSAFHYAKKSRHTIVAVDLNCPCCNMDYELYCNKSSILRAYYESAMQDCDDFPAYVRENSPINMISRLPKIPYRFAVGLSDPLLAPSQHSFKMISLMRDAGFDVAVREYPGAGHCSIGVDGLAEEHRWLMGKMLGEG